ncbi:hypothetical protein FRX31_020488 [Thalictrum thalictroides]|uniref:Uncharacterized protein n=1 Tax=Thalictrum thalictroides TaxID=46969 RepID=A0A7J6VXR0_THATH|nr:hypothetical protein FRX31_020488 [Thalictrum thalictroides]
MQCCTLKSGARYTSGHWSYLSRAWIQFDVIGLIPGYCVDCGPIRSNKPTSGVRVWKRPNG